MADRNSYVPEEKWEDYIERIASRYPYKMPPAIKRGPHPRVYSGGVHISVPGGTLSPRVLKQMKR